MKLKELFEAHRPGMIKHAGPTEQFKKHTPGHTQQTYAKIKETEVYKELTTSLGLKDVTTDASLTRGTLMFTDEKLVTKEHPFNKYRIQLNGQIRVGDSKSKYSSLLVSPEVSRDELDLFKIYSNALEELKKKVISRRAKHSRKIDIQGGTFPSLTLYKDMPEKLVSSVRLKNVARLENLEGLPTRASGKILIKNCHDLKSLKGFPQRVAGDIELETLPKLQSLEFICPVIETGLRLKMLGPSVNFERINRIITEFNPGATFVTDDVEGGLLSLLKIKGLPKIGMDFDAKQMYPEFYDAINIINRFRGGSIFDCQEALIKNGLKEHAKL